jgi:hypothetical protein
LRCVAGAVQSGCLRRLTKGLCPPTSNCPDPDSFAPGRRGPGGNGGVQRRVPAGAGRRWRRLAVTASSRGP